MPHLLTPSKEEEKQIGLWMPMPEALSKELSETAPLKPFSWQDIFEPKEPKISDTLKAALNNPISR